MHTITTRMVLIAAAIGVVSLTAVNAANASPAVSAKAKTCAAARAWDRHRTAANLDAVMADSFHVTWKYLGEDVDRLYTDVRSGKTKYVLHDLRYIERYDCA